MHLDVAMVGQMSVTIVLGCRRLGYDPHGYWVHKCIWVDICVWEITPLGGSSGNMFKCSEFYVGYIHPIALLAFLANSERLTDIASWFMLTLRVLYSLNSIPSSV